MTGSIDIERLQTILKADVGAELSFEDVYAFGHDLVDFLELLAEPSMDEDVGLGYAEG